MLDEILVSEPLPLIWFKDHMNRTLKTKAARRYIPVHPELIRLNFFAYRQVMRAAGHVDLFPELRPDGQQSWAFVCIKHFDYIRKAAYPNVLK
jgi:hypothetical protein